MVVRTNSNTLKHDINANDEFNNSQFIDDKLPALCNCNQPEIDECDDQGVYYCLKCKRRIDQPEAEQEDLRYLDQY
jgi:broad specificity polyphosphatase/5'/3'-nucleotidase SurE